MKNLFRNSSSIQALIGFHVCNINLCLIFANQTRNNHSEIFYHSIFIDFSSSKGVYECTAWICLAGTNVLVFFSRMWILHQIGAPKIWKAYFVLKPGWFVTRIGYPNRLSRTANANKPYASQNCVRLQGWSSLGSRYTGFLMESSCR